MLNAYIFLFIGILIKILKKHRKWCVIDGCRNEKRVGKICSQHHNAKGWKNSDDPRKKKLFLEISEYSSKVQAIRQSVTTTCCVDTESGPCKNKVRPSLQGLPNPVCGKHRDAKPGTVEFQEYSTHKQLNSLHILITKLENTFLRQCKRCGETAETQNFNRHPCGIGFVNICNRCRSICFDHSINPLGTKFDVTPQIWFIGACKPCKRNGKYQHLLCHFGDCDIQITKRSAYGQFCETHFKIENPDHAVTRNSKTKEKLFLQNFEDHLYHLYDLPLDVEFNERSNIYGHDGDGKKHLVHVDYIIVRFDRILFIEFDEKQHKRNYYEPTYQDQRSQWIREHARNLGKKEVLMRFNPDYFAAMDGTKFKSCFTKNSDGQDIIADTTQWNLRNAYFYKMVEFYLTCDVLDLPNDIQFFFFDNFDMSKLNESSSEGGSSGKKRKIE